MVFRALVRGLSSKLINKFKARAGRRQARLNKRLLVEGLEDRRVMAANPLAIEFSGAPFTSNPQSMMEVNGAVYFQASSRGFGAELWKSDGTTAGTQLVKDLVPALDVGSYPTNLTNFNGQLVFTANDPSTGQPRLWKSDGTAAGTSMIDTNVNAASSPGQLTVVGNTLYFVAQRTGTNSTGPELWKTDGTATGTVLIKDIVRGSAGSNPASLVNVGGTLFFVATTASTGSEIWKSDGTAASTVQVRDIVAGSGSSYPSRLINSAGTLYFSATNPATGQELWKSNGTSAGTTVVRDIGSGATGSYPYYLTDVAGTVFFSVGSELWKTDGTALGTVQVETGPGGSSSPRSLINANGTLYFSAFGSGTGVELWKSDGTAGGTVLVSDIDNSVSSTYPQQMLNIGSTLYFTASVTGLGRELFKSDGTAGGTVLVKDINAGAFGSDPSYMTAASGKLLFVAADPDTSREVWVSDGTTAGTHLTKDINPASDGGSPNQSVVVGSTLFFVAGNGAAGVELWKSDGTVAGTSMVRDIFAGTASSYPSDLINVNGTLYFVASNENGRELWKTTGTSAGTVMVADLNGSYSSSPQELVNIGSTLYFTANDNALGRELWKTTGTAATTTLVSDINPGTGSYPTKLTAVSSTLFFTADDGTNGRELWKSSGTAASTVLVNNINTGSYSTYFSDLTAVGTTLYFVASRPFEGQEVWKSNGTSSGTVVLKNIVPEAYASSYPSQLTNVNGTLYFAARESLNGNFELFKSDGTSAGTVAVEGIESLMNNPNNLTNVSGVLYFTAFEELGSTGVELWKSDGTLAGTSLVQDIVPGLESSSPQKLFNAGGSLVFTVDSPATGAELWKSNGTSAGTSLLVDLWPGPVSSDVTNLRMLGSLLTFTADNGVTGTELFVLSANQAPLITVPVSPLSTNEDTAVGVSGLVISDADADIADIQVTLTVPEGSLFMNIAVPGGVIASQVIGNGTGSLIVKASLAAINTTLAFSGGLTYTPPANQAISTPLVVSVNDLGNIGLGTALSDTKTLTIDVVPVNDPPVLSFSSGSVVAMENGPATLLDATAAISDIDSNDFDTGVVLVQLSAIDSGDRLSVRNEGTGPGQIGVTGHDVSYGGTIIGTVSAGQSGGSLSIDLNAAATSAAVTALLRCLQFSTVSENPSASPRSLLVSVTDGDGGSTITATVTATVTAINDAPVLSMPGSTVSYNENAVSTILDPAATVSDIENNWSGGSIVASISVGASGNDVLEINHQGFGLNQIGVSGSFVLFGTAAGPVVIGSFTGGTSGAPLAIALTANANPTAITGLLRNLSFRTQGDAPSTNTRTVEIQVSDSAAAGNIANRNVTVISINDAPVISFTGPAVTYTENGAALQVIATATVSDVDSADLATGKLTVSIAANGVSTDILAVRNQGTGIGQIGVSGTSVSYEGVVFGTLAGGTSLNPLVVTLNANATPVAAQALVQNVTYRANTEAPTNLARTVQFVLTDGDGGTSATLSQTVNVVPVNDRSVIAAIPPTNSYVENGLPVILAPAATVADVDSPNYLGGNLTVRYLAGGTADDRLGIRNEGFGVGEIGIAGLSVLFGGQTIGTFTSTSGVGTTILRVFLNVNATAERTRALVRNITYSNVSDNPAAAPRTIQFLLNDGGGGTSLSVTQVMSVTAVNDAPTLTLPGAVGTYVSEGAPIDIDTGASLDDPDSADFDSGVLNVSFVANATSDDVLEIRNEGVGAGQIGVSGSDVTFGGITIGTFTGGSGLVPLSITLNASATTSAVQALLRKITFRINGPASSTLTRTIGFQLSDGDGGSTALINKDVMVSL